MHIIDHRLTSDELTLKVLLKYVDACFLNNQKSPKTWKKPNGYLSKWPAVQFRCVYFSMEKKVKYILKVDCYFIDTEIR